MLTGEDEDGNYLWNPKDGFEAFMLYNPVSDNYWLTRVNKAPQVMMNHAFRTCFCRRLRYRAFMVPKCGSSSIVASTLVYDGMVEPSRVAAEDGISWESCPEAELIIQRLCTVRNMNADRAALKHFTVLDEPMRRFMRWVNYTWTKGYNRYLNRKLDDFHYIEELLWALPYITRYKPDMDEHVVLQSVHAAEAERFDFRPEWVKLSRLPQFYEKAFGKPLIKSNVTKVEKRFKGDAVLAPVQRERIMEYLEPDYALWRSLGW